MKDLIEEIGEPDVRIEGLRLWITSPISQPSEWYRGRVQIYVPGQADVRHVICFEGRDLGHWRSSIDDLQRHGTSTWKTFEEELEIHMKATDGLGHIELRVMLSMEMSHRFEFVWEIDQSYLPILAKALDAVNTKLDSPT